MGFRGGATRFHAGGVEVEGAQESDLGATAAKFDAGLASLAVLWQGQQVFGVPVPVPGGVGVERL